LKPPGWIGEVRRPPDRGAAVLAAIALTIVILRPGRKLEQLTERIMQVGSQAIMLLARETIDTNDERIGAVGLPFGCDFEIDGAHTRTCVLT
jgi:hypothetical protein